MQLPSTMDDSEWTLLQLVAQAADLCRKPLRHAVRYQGEAPTTIGDCSDCCLLIEARNPDGERLTLHDLELEIYRSGNALNLMLSSAVDDAAPVLWHGNHPVWMHPENGERCERPGGGAPLEALCRRLKALLSNPDP
jgi:hypothetical protein